MGEPGRIYKSVLENGKGEMRAIGDPASGLYQIRCPFVDPDWSFPMTAAKIRECYCYEGARCVIDAVPGAIPAGKTQIADSSREDIR